MKVCLGADTLGYPEGGGHLWVYLNWALGLRALGCEVLWLETVGRRTTAAAICARAEALQARLAPFGLGESLVLCSNSGDPLPPAASGNWHDFAAAREADLLLNLHYSLSADVVQRFRRSALVDIDPGLLQIWLRRNEIQVARYDRYFTIGEHIEPTERSGEVIVWEYTPPCVALDWWPVAPALPGAPFTTVSHWSGEEWVEDADGYYSNDKRSGFLPYLDLPQHVSQPLELAICLGADEDEERHQLERLGWRVRGSAEVSSTPQDYQRYIQGSRGEFSCAKPSCIRLQHAWISDRTLCYLASGKPAVVQHTGPSRRLPDAAGLFRFRDKEEAIRSLERAASDYERHSRLARSLAEELFDARRVVGHVLERTLS